MAFIPLWLAGAILSIIGSTFSNLGVNIQKYSAMQEEKRDGEYRSFWCQPMWVSGFAFVAFGSFFDFAALAFAAQSIVATVGAMTLVSNIFFAHMWLGETLTYVDLVGTVLILCGSGLAVAFGDQTEVEFTADQLRERYYRWVFLMYLAGSGGFALILYLILKKAEPIRQHITDSKKSHQELYGEAKLEEVLGMERRIEQLNDAYTKYEKVHPFAYCALAGFFGSLVLIFAKSVAELIRATASGSNEFATYWTYLYIFGLAFCIVTETKYLATGLRYFDALYVVPVFQCFFISLGASAGGVFFGEFERMDTLQIIMFPVGVCVTLVGVYLLSSREMNGERDQLDAMGKGFIGQRTETRHRFNTDRSTVHTDGVEYELGKDEDTDDEDSQMSASGGRPVENGDGTAVGDMTSEEANGVETRAKSASQIEMESGDTVDVEPLELKPVGGMTMQLALNVVDETVQDPGNGKRSRGHSEDGADRLSSNSRQGMHTRTASKSVRLNKSNIPNPTRTRGTSVARHAHKQAQLQVSASKMGHMGGSIVFTQLMSLIMPSEADLEKEDKLEVQYARNRGRTLSIQSPVDEDKQIVGKKKGHARHRSAGGSHRKTNSRAGSAIVTTRSSVSEQREKKLAELNKGRQTEIHPVKKQSLVDEEELREHNAALESSESSHADDDDQDRIPTSADIMALAKSHEQESAPDEHLVEDTAAASEEPAPTDVAIAIDQKAEDVQEQQAE